MTNGNIVKIKTVQGQHREKGLEVDTCIRLRNDEKDQAKRSHQRTGKDNVLRTK